MIQPASNMSKKHEMLADVTVRFAGDSGDGMQLTGGQFSNTTAIMGNDLSTLPDFPAEIRAPVGTLEGVSGFQIRFASNPVFSPGDACDVLVAMNPAALKSNLAHVKEGGMLILNGDAFKKANLRKAKWEVDPLESDVLGAYQVFNIPIEKLTQDALADSGLGRKQVVRCKNFFALGIVFWLFSRDMKPTTDWLRTKFKKIPDVAEANIKALKTGYNYALTCDLMGVNYEIKPAKNAPGLYRNLMGNTLTAYGLVAGSELSGVPLFLGSYPITPASQILQELAALREYGVRTAQMEDEIAAICSAVGASYGGALGVTSTSGPGLALKGEALGLAVILELPLVVINVQRGGPSTGLPTKTEQSDLLQTVFGRNGECPLAVLAASTPSDCFHAAIEACRIALEHMTPVVLLTDGYLGNGSEPFKLPDISKLPKITPRVATPESAQFDGEGNFLPYARDERLVRQWAVPGTKGLQHRVGGLEKADGTGHISYNPENHHNMCVIRRQKILNIADSIPEQEIFGPQSGKLLMLSWGGTFGVIRQAVERMQAKGADVAHAHLRYIQPFPRNLESVLKSFDKVVIPEINLGQLRFLIQGTFAIPCEGFNLVRGLPFKILEVEAKIAECLGLTEEQS